MKNYSDDFQKSLSNDNIPRPLSWRYGDLLHLRLLETSPAERDLLLERFEELTRLRGSSLSLSAIAQYKRRSTRAPTHHNLNVEPRELPQVEWDAATSEALADLQPEHLENFLQYLRKDVLVVGHPRMTAAIKSIGKAREIPTEAHQQPELWARYARAMHGAVKDMAPGERVAFLQHVERNAQATYDQEALWSVEAYRQIFQTSAPKPTRS